MRPSRHALPPRLHQSFTVGALVACLLLVASAAHAQQPSIIAELTAPEGSGTYEFGRYFALHGSRVAVALNNPDRVFLYQETGDGRWALADSVRGDSVGSGFGQLDDAIALNDSLLVVGAYKEKIGPSQHGAVYVYRIEQDGTLTRTQKLQREGLQVTGTTFLGTSVHLACGYLFSASSVHYSDFIAIYRMDTDGLFRFAQVLAPPGRWPTGYFGQTIVTDCDSGLLASPDITGGGGEPGQVFVFARQPDSTWKQEARLDQIDAGYAERNPSYFGYATALYRDRLFIAEVRDGRRAFVFNRVEGEKGGYDWALSGTLPYPEGIDPDVGGYPTRLMVDGDVLYGFAREDEWDFGAHTLFVADPIRPVHLPRLFDASPPLGVAHMKIHGGRAAAMSQDNFTSRRLLLLDLSGAVALPDAPVAALRSDSNWARLAGAHPFSDQMSLSVTLSRAEQVMVEVHDILGRLASRSVQSLGAGESRIHVPVDGAAGVYLVRVSMKDKHASFAATKR